MLGNDYTPPLKQYDFPATFDAYQRWRKTVVRRNNGLLHLSRCSSTSCRSQSPHASIVDLDNDAVDYAALANVLTESHLGNASAATLPASVARHVSLRASLLEGVASRAVASTSSSSSSSASSSSTHRLEQDGSDEHELSWAAALAARRLRGLLGAPIVGRSIALTALLCQRRAQTARIWREISSADCSGRSATCAVVISIRYPNVICLLFVLLFDVLTQHLCHQYFMYDRDAPTVAELRQFARSVASGKVRRSVFGLSLAFLYNGGRIRASRRASSVCRTCRCTRRPPSACSCVLPFRHSFSLASLITFSFLVSVRARLTKQCRRCGVRWCVCFDV